MKNFMNREEVGRMGFFGFAIPAPTNREKRSIYYDDIVDNEPCYERAVVLVGGSNECQIECNPRIFYDIC